MPAPRLGVGETVSVPLDRLKPYPRNARAGDIELITASLRAHGQYRALVVQRSTDYVLAGNHTLHGLHEVGATEALVHYLDVDDDQAARINLVDNRANDVAKYEDGLLADLLRSLEEPTLGTGWSEEALGQLYERVDGPKQGLTDPDDVPEAPERAVTQPGDLWLLGEHRLLCGDSTAASDVQRLMGAGTAVLVATDPPYGVDYAQVVGGRKNQKVGGWRDIQGDALADEPLFQLVRDALTLTDARTLFLWHAAKRVPVFIRAMEEAGFQIAQQIIWVKNALVFGGSDYQWRHEPCFYARRPGSWCDADRTQTTVWEFSKEYQPNHPTQKPVELFQTPMRRHTHPGDVCYEPFAGSGSQIIAAHLEGRRCYAVEIDPLYCDVICRRYEEFTGVTPILEATGKPHSFVVQEQAA